MRVDRLLVLAGALGATACQRNKPPEDLSKVVTRLDFGRQPQIPPPEANSYAIGEQEPSDPIVAELLAGRRTDGSLAGACAGIALALAEADGRLTRWELRESAWRAGWPYPVSDARRWDTVLEGAPPRELLTWITDTPLDVPIAMVRARGRDRDHWVGMRSQPAIDLGVLPRLAELGTPLTLPAVPGARYTVADGSGRLTVGSLDAGAKLLLATNGEWLVEITRDGTELARFPIYVGIDGPSTPVLRLGGPPPPMNDAEDADALARRLLRHIRQVYGVPPYTPMPMLDAAVGSYLTDPSQGSARVLTALGFSADDAEVWACDDVTVAACLDRWLWDPRRRQYLLTDVVDAYGLHTELDATGVHLTMLLVDTGPR